MRFGTLWKAVALSLLLSLPSGVVAETSASRLAPEVLLLGRIKYHMARILAEQPDYTCLQTIIRSRRQAPSKRYRLEDTVRLEVALVGGKEMFSWPGSREFEVSDLRQLLPTGTVSNGEFALHARAVFLSPYVRYEFAGEEELAGRRLVRYNYWVPLMGSGYRIRVGEAEAVVAYHGAFWVEPQSLDLARLDVIATEIPPELGLLEVQNTMEYRRVPIGGQSFLLPQRAVVVLRDLVGNESRNEIQFHDCRHYTGESVISFAPPPEPEPEREKQAGPARGGVIRLPEGLELELELETEIEGAHAAVGDPIRAVVASSVRRKGQLLVPKGAIVEGRLLHVEKVPARVPYYVVALEFHTIHLPPYEAPFHAVLEEIPTFVGFGGRATVHFSELGPLAGRVRVVPGLGNRPGAGVFYVKGEKLRLPRGTRLLWRTREIQSQQKAEP